jgi:hypothetical protein
VQIRSATGGCVVTRSGFGLLYAICRWLGTSGALRPVVTLLRAGRRAIAVGTLSNGHPAVSEPAQPGQPTPPELSYVADRASDGAVGCSQQWKDLCKWLPVRQHASDT